MIRNLAARPVFEITTVLNWQRNAEIVVDLERLIGHHAQPIETFGCSQRPVHIWYLHSSDATSKIETEPLNTGPLVRSLSPKAFDDLGDFAVDLNVDC
jgi:hypothetical protein